MRPLRSAIQSGRLCPRACRTRSSGSVEIRGPAGRREAGTAAITCSSGALRGGVPGPSRSSRKRAAPAGKG